LVCIEDVNFQTDFETVTMYAAFGIANPSSSA
jgi:hypothetical protein